MYICIHFVVLCTYRRLAPRSTHHVTRQLGTNRSLVAKQGLATSNHPVFVDLGSYRCVNCSVGFDCRGLSLAFFSFFRMKLGPTEPRPAFLTEPHFDI